MNSLTLRIPVEVDITAPGLEELLRRTLTSATPPRPEPAPDVVAFVSYIRGRGERPDTVDRAAAYFAYRLYRVVPDTLRSAVIERLAPLVGTASDRGHDPARVYLSVDTLVRAITPIWLDAAGRGDDAAAVRALDPLVDTASSARARGALSDVLDGLSTKKGGAREVARRTVSWARAYAGDGASAGAFALGAIGGAGAAVANAGAALARSEDLAVPPSALEASDAALLDLLDRMVEITPLAQA